MSSRRVPHVNFARMTLPWSRLTDVAGALHEQRPLRDAFLKETFCFEVVGGHK